MYTLIKTISSTQNLLLKETKRLIQSPQKRKNHNLMVLEGIHLAQAFLDGNPTHIISMFINEDNLLNPEIGKVIHTVPQETNIYKITRQCISSISELNSPPEILMVVGRPTTKTFNNRDSIVCLENIQDPGNLGTICRSAAASGINHVALSTNCTDPFSVRTLRAAMGAHFSLNIYENINIPSFLLCFKGKTIATVLNQKSISLYDCDLTSPVAFIFGNEGKGLSKPLINFADERVSIPMPGGATESLNVGIAASIFFFEQNRQKYHTKKIKP